jgi:fatty-acyl-CoA synthase
MAIIVVRPCKHVTQLEIRTHLRDFANRGLISAYAVPEHEVFIEALPTTSVGKIDKKVLHEKYAW